MIKQPVCILKAFFKKINSLSSFLLSFQAQENAVNWILVVLLKILVKIHQA